MCRSYLPANLPARLPVNLPAMLLAMSLTAWSLSGCGLIDKDITYFDLSLPEQQFTIDTSQWGLSADPTFPAIPCSLEADICADATAAYCSADQCVGVCDGATGTCKARVLVALSQQINLIEEKPELQSINDQPIINVTIDTVEYRITENTLNFESPEITIYVAPINVISPLNPEARPIGTIAPIEASRQRGWTEVQFTPDGKASLRQFMGDYRSIFNVIVGAWAEIQAGDDMPAGRALTEIRVEAHAGL
jgi:hypothetical protein